MQQQKREKERQGSTYCVIGWHGIMSDWTILAFVVHHPTYTCNCFPGQGNGSLAGHFVYNLWNALSLRLPMARQESPRSVAGDFN